MITQNEVYELMKDYSPDGMSFWFSDRNFSIIEEELGWKKEPIMKHLRNLRKKGLLIRYTSRTYVFSERFQEFLKK